jgi:thiol-disulfide isomerase/thioredoxin
MYSEKLIRCLVICTTSLLLYAVTSFATPLKRGDAFPELGSYQLEGTLPERLQGKVLLVDFWASWCAPCRRSFAVYDALHDKYQEKGLVLIGISVDDDVDMMQTFLEKNPVSFPVLRDVGQQLVAQCSIKTMPTLFLIDQQGVVRFVHNGFGGEETKEQLIAQIEGLIE